MVDETQINIILLEGELHSLMAYKTLLQIKTATNYSYYIIFLNLICIRAICIIILYNLFYTSCIIRHHVNYNKSQQNEMQVLFNTF